MRRVDALGVLDSDQVGEKVAPNMARCARHRASGATLTAGYGGWLGRGLERRGRAADADRGDRERGRPRNAAASSPSRGREDAVDDRRLALLLKFLLLVRREP